MAPWRFLITPEAEYDLSCLDRPIQKRIVEKLEWLVEHFDTAIPIPLGGPWRGFFKLRVGDWRIIYEIETETRRIVVHAIGRRDEIYKQ